ncbi:MAG: bifunctional folylpolyglutamate synthase/dihydrofolate synthase [Clostridia bacterium]|nr:bifunctional folylpolyglutamate synthase/dihydrofolate synthase [Clostridia bacterium]
MNCEEAIQYIHSTGWNRGIPGLTRVCALLEAIGNPQEAVRCIHVAGTNGKGSTCTMLDSILRAAGYHVGLFTSPYIREFRERIRVDGELIAEDALAELTEQVASVARTLNVEPTEFEIVTAIGFAYFARKGVDVVVLEVGLGGRFDPTNVIKNPLLSIITGIDFDHVAMLGNTIQEIAAEKAGIIKEGRPCLYGGEENAACRTIRSFADMRHAPFYTVDRSDYVKKSATLDGTVFDFHGMTDLMLSLLGSYQPHNATVVLTALELLAAEGLPVSEQAIRDGLASVEWIARFELLSRDPIVIYDGGHNPQGVKVAVQSIRGYFPEENVNILSGVMADKDYDEMIEALKPVTYQAFTVTPGNSRALSALEYAQQFENHKIPAFAFESVDAAVCAAIADSKESGRPLICLGSLYLYSAVADAVKQQ